MVFQDPTDSLNPRFTAARAIADPIMQLGDIKGCDALRAKCEDLARQVGLPLELLDRFPHQMSGGQKARVGIARAIALQPKLIILDEPTAALDVSVQAVVLNLLQDLKQSMGMSYLFVSHDLNVVRLLCDRVIVMRTGRIVEQGLTEAVLDAPQDAYTKELLSAIPHPPLPVHLIRMIERGTVAEPLDDYIDAVAGALGLPIEDAWKPSVRANLAVTLKMAKMVDEFALPDETEPASIYASLILSSHPKAIGARPPTSPRRLPRRRSRRSLSPKLRSARIAQHNPVLNAFTDVTADRARATAKALDAAIAAGQSVGPLGRRAVCGEEPVRCHWPADPRRLQNQPRSSSLDPRCDAGRAHGGRRRRLGRRAQYGRIRL